MVIMQVDYSCSDVPAEVKVICIMVWDGDRGDPGIVPQESRWSCHYEGLQKHLPHKEKPLDACPKFHTMNPKEPNDKMRNLHEIHAEAGIYH